MERAVLIHNLESIDLSKVTKDQGEAISHAASIIRAIAPSDFKRGEALHAVEEVANDDSMCCGGGCHTMGGPC